MMLFGACWARTGSGSRGWVDKGAELFAGGWGALFGEGPGGVEGAVVVCGGWGVDWVVGGGDGGEEELGGEAVPGGAEREFVAGEGPAVWMSVQSVPWLEG